MEKKDEAKHLGSGVPHEGVVVGLHITDRDVSAAKPGTIGFSTAPRPTPALRGGPSCGQRQPLLHVVNLHERDSGVTAGP
jgi:hypothetical protein